MLVGERLPDPDTIKMFMGQISKSLDEDNLKAYLSEYGQIYEVKIIRDKTGTSRGCAFVTFYTRKDALTAQMALHNLKTMPGLIHPIQMTPADGPNLRCAVEDRRLFIGKVQKTLTEDELREAFLPFGEIENLYIVREMNEPKLCKGCAFVTYTKKESAINSINNLHMTKVFKNSSEPTVVKIADTQKEKERKRNLNNFKFNQQMSPNGNAMLNQMNCNVYPNPSINSSLPNNPQNEICNESNRDASPLQQFLLAALASSPLMQSNPGAIANLLAATGMSGTKQGMGSIQQVNSTTSTPVNSLTSNFTPHQSTSFPQSMMQGSEFCEANPMLNMQAYGNEVMTFGLQNSYAVCNQPEGGPSNIYQPQLSNKTKGPEGANLFIYHLPLECRDQDLHQMFAPWGNVISATVFMDKKINESKCFGFVSYDSPASAEIAIRQMNGFQIGSKRLKVSLKTSNPKPY